MFYDKFISLCAQKGESPTQVSKNIGLSNAAATGWKNGKKPNDITIKRLADYFGVPVDALKEPENVFYENYLRLCNSVKKSPSAVALEVGLKKSSVTRWKAGGNGLDGAALGDGDIRAKGYPVPGLALVGIAAQRDEPTAATMHDAAVAANHIQQRDVLAGGYIDDGGICIFSHDISPF